MPFSAIFVPDQKVAAFRVARNMLRSSKTGSSFDLMCCGHLPQFAGTSSISAGSGIYEPALIGGKFAKQMLTLLILSISHPLL